MLYPLSYGGNSRGEVSSDVPPFNSMFAPVVSTVALSVTAFP